MFEHVSSFSGEHAFNNFGQGHYMWIDIKESWRTIEELPEFLRKKRKQPVKLTFVFVVVLCSYAALALFSEAVVRGFYRITDSKSPATTQLSSISQTAAVGTNGPTEVTQSMPSGPNIGNAAGLPMVKENTPKAPPVDDFVRQPEHTQLGEPPKEGQTSPFVLAQPDEQPRDDNMWSPTHSRLASKSSDSQENTTPAPQERLNTEPPPAIRERSQVISALNKWLKGTGVNP